MNLLEAKPNRSPLTLAKPELLTKAPVSKSLAELEFTGERIIPGEVDFQLEAEHRSRYEFAARVLPKGRVLDDGCGAGYGSLILAHQDLQVVGIDIDAKTINHCRQNSALSAITFQKEDSANLSFPDNSFDGVVSFEVIEHVVEFTRYVSEALRVLRPGGLLIISTPNKRVYSDIPKYCNPFHVHEFYVDEFRRLLESLCGDVKMLGQWNTAGIMIGHPSLNDLPLRSDWLLRNLAIPPTEEEWLEKARYVVAICRKAGLESRPPSVVPSHSFVTDLCLNIPAAPPQISQSTACDTVEPSTTPVRFGKGFYQDEGGWRWMGAEGRVQIPASATPLLMDCDLTCSPLRFYGCQSFEVRVMHNGKRIRTETFRQDDETRHVELLIPKSEEDITIQFASSAFFLPSRCGWPSDQRELSIRFQRLVFNTPEDSSQKRRIRPLYEQGTTQQLPTK